MIAKTLPCLPPELPATLEASAIAQVLPLDLVDGGWPNVGLPSRPESQKSAPKELVAQGCAHSGAAEEVTWQSKRLLSAVSLLALASLAACGADVIAPDVIAADVIAADVIAQTPEEASETASNEPQLERVAEGDDEPSVVRRYGRSPRWPF